MTTKPTDIFSIKRIYCERLYVISFWIKGTNLLKHTLSKLVGKFQSSSQVYDDLVFTVVSLILRIYTGISV